MNKIFLTDFKRLAVLLLPEKLRQKVVMALLEVMMLPWSYIKRSLSEYARSKENELKITGQVCKLRKLLNDSFDNEERRIRIVDSMEIDLPMVYVFPSDSNQVLYLYPDNPPVWLQTDSKVASVRTDFYIELPEQLSNLVNDARLKALVNTYKLASKRWFIRIK